MPSNLSSGLRPAATLGTAAAIIAFQVGGRATRDALFLSSFPYTALPAMITVTSLVSVALAYLSTRLLLRWGPDRVMPVAFVASAALLLTEWAVSLAAPRAAAVLVYLHFGGLGALLISGFWSFLNERLDPRSAKRQLGGITAAGTVGGLIGGLAATQVARLLPVNAMLPLLAGLHLLCAAGMAWIRGGGSPAVASVRPAGASSRSEGGPSAKAADMELTSPGVRALAATPYIRGLITLVVLGTVAEGLLDFVLKGRASAAMAAGGGLLQFFAAFYTGVALLTVLVQAVASRFVLERLGPARSAAVLPAGTAVAAVGALVVPGLPSAVFARGTESVLSNSLYRAGYEVLFTPVPARDKRSIKALVDVGASRGGDLLAAGIAQSVVLLAMPVQGAALLTIAVLLSVAALVVAYRLHGGYVEALARGLISRAVHLDIADATDSITRSTLLRTLQLSRSSIAAGSARFRAGAATEGTGEISEAPPEGESPEAARARALSTRDADAVRRALAEGPLPEELIPHVVSLLAWDPVAREAIASLRNTGAASIDPLVERLLDSDTDFTIRRRVPLVLGMIPDPRAVQGLLRSLADRRFEVRYRSGRALAHLQSVDPALSVRPDQAFAAVLREIQTSAGVWEGRHLLDHMDDEAWSTVMDDLVRERAERSLEHVFNLLGLALPRQPLRIAFRGLHTDDPLLRGTALEYLESSLPAVIRTALWPYIERDADRERRRAQARPPGAAMDELVRMNETIAIKLEELRRKG